MNSAKMSVILPKYPSGTPKTLCSASPMLQNPFVSPQNPHPYTTKKRQFSARFCGYSVKITHKLPFFGAQHRFVLRFLTFRPERKRTVNRRSSLRSSPASSLLFRGLSFVSARPSHPPAAPACPRRFNTALYLFIRSSPISIPSFRILCGIRRSAAPVRAPARSDPRRHRRP